MSTGKYNAALSIFFVSYAVFEPLANILLKRLRPSVFIPIIMYASHLTQLLCLTSNRIIWGVCMLSMGFVTSWSGLMVCRFFLGLAEAGLFPGVNYFLSSWYKRNEFGVRAVSQSILPTYISNSPPGHLLLGRRTFRIFWWASRCRYSEYA